MTDLDLDAIRARADAATEGPWRAWNRNVGWNIAIGDECDQWDRPVRLLPEGLRTDIARAEDAEFIAHARGDIPALLAEVNRLRAHILDIAAHATPYGDIPDDPGWVGTYLLTAGALHRALGTIGHTAPSCQAEAERDEARAGRDRLHQLIARMLAAFTEKGHPGRPCLRSGWVDETVVADWHRIYRELS